MWLKQLFTDEPIDFEKRCKTRIGIGICVTLLGILTVLMAIFVNRPPILYIESGSRAFINGFYMGAGGGLIGVGIVNIIMNCRYLKNPELKRKRAIVETDERNRILGLRTWAYAGYSMFLIMYIGILLAGFISMTVMKVLLAVGAVYGLLLFLFRTILKRCM